MPVKRSKKAPKDKNAPKKPLSAYFIFSNERRPIIKETNKELKITEISKLIAKEWKSLDSDIKNEYNLKASQAKKEYEKAFKEYKQTDSFKKHQLILKQYKSEQKETNDLIKKRKKKSRKGKPKKPKKPEGYPKSALSAYFLYQNYRRISLKQDSRNLKTTEITKIVAKEWQELTNEQKEPYNIQAKNDKDKFLNEMKQYKITDEYKNYIELENEYKQKLKEWNNSMEVDDYDDRNNNNNNNNNNNGTPNGIKKLKLPKKPKDKNAPKKVGTAYLLFSNEKRSELVNSAKENNEKPQMKEIQKKIGELWKALNDDEKKIYQTKVENRKQEYNKLLTEYKQSDQYKLFQDEIKKWQIECEKRKTDHKNKLKLLSNKNKKKKKKKTNKDSDDDSSSDDSSSDDSSSSDESSSDGDDSSSEASSSDSDSSSD